MFNTEARLTLILTPKGLNRRSSMIFPYLDIYDCHDFLFAPNRIVGVGTHWTN